MKQFNILAHTADVRLKVVGSTSEELFNAALEGMAGIIAPGCCQSPLDVDWELSVSSGDQTALLVDFLSDVLTHTQLTKTVFCQAIFVFLTPQALKAQLKGRRVSEFAEDIKAVTYHEANVVKDVDGNWSTILVFDI